jgi:phosphate transport system substrate-binding protein
MAKPSRKLLTLCLFVLATVVLTPASAHELEIHGSNTVGATLAPMLVSGYLQQLGDSNPSSRPTGEENEQILSVNAGGRNLSVLVAAHGSSTGFRTLASGQAGIWASSRPVKPSEAEQVRMRADLTALESEHVIAIDGLAILVHPSNPINQLSIDTIGRIFAGDIRNWAELGGSNRPISLYARDDRSGTWDTFKSLVLGKDYQLDASALRYESNDQLSDDVSRDPGGIGFSGLASVRRSKLVAVSDGDAPALRPGDCSCTPWAAKPRTLPKA